MSRAGAARVGPEVVVIEGAAPDGRGLARVDERTLRVEGALPGESVTALRARGRRGRSDARVVEVLRAAAGRVTPRCRHFGTCGGCVLQHASASLQRSMKVQVLRDALAEVGLQPDRWMPPVAGPEWGYRRRARLSCRYVEKKGRVLVGFRERGRAFVSDLERCEVLAPPVGALLADLARCIDDLDQKRAIAQIEVAVADNVTALVLRNLAPLGDADRDRLRTFGAAHGVEFHLQPGGYDTVVPLTEPATVPVYRLPAFDMEVAFEPVDFVQVNAGVNAAMVERVVDLLAPSGGDAVLDLFCGVGNFSLPLARVAGSVTGVEGADALVKRATTNAARNGLANCAFHAADLSSPDVDVAWAAQRYDRVLLDPPRAGALAVLPLMRRWSPERVVYVSCNPATLARDAAELVDRYGFRLRAAAIADMFPHTAHVESIALFEADAHA